jgi:hypothetical protein
MSQITSGQQQLNIKPILQQNFPQQPKKFVKGLSSELHDVSPHNHYQGQHKGSVVLNFDSNRDHNG